MVSNIFGSRERIGEQIGLPPGSGGMAVSHEYARLEREKIAPVVIGAAEAPIKETLQTGMDIDLLRLPIVRHYEMDLSPVLTHMLVMKVPDEGFYDISFTKLFPKGPDKAGVSIRARNHFYKEGAGWKIIIDATKQTVVSSPVRFRVPPEAMERIKLKDYVRTRGGERR
ncbi:UbiD family decarboxylase domain-containing protein [Ferviditalea candida]|uniref:UbiD family decarboxylase domain-containing protein n=1 Tax=Ferviditalea candida TaxID=3108399 RepID=UPI00352DE9EB